MSGDKKFERIPHDIVPVNYNITFHCDLKNFVFNGYLVLDVNVKESTETLQLNVKEVQLSDVTCGSIKGTPSINAEKELVVIKFDSPLPKGDAKISLNFKGIHNDVMMGFYRSKYNLPNGKEVFNLSTQFESTFARRAFPCIDEPDRKATFEITLVVPDNLVAISNMPEISRKKLEKPANLPNLEDGAGYVEVKFDKTPIMSTYLLAMVVGHFEFIEDKDSNGIPIRVYTPIGKKHCGEFAMDVTKKCLPFYTNCFGVGYPLPKIDLIAIPDFAAGAMENWGLVTYRETALLIDPAQSSRALLQRVAIVVAHELAHMWFGNLVTMKWWTHLWLNEGFATWMEYHATDSVLPEFDLWTQFACDEQSTAFSLDGLKSSHPIEVEVKNPDEVDEIFDMISYAKGASVIKMLFSYIGKDKFFAGLKDYINKFKYSNTETFDLWNAFSASSGEKINELMDSWTQKMGYPIVEITRNGDDLKFSQSRYLSDGSKEEEPKSHWTIPLKICKADSNEVIIETIKMPNDGSEVKVKCTEKNIRVNPNRSSFVRIQYDDATLKSIMEVVKDKKLKPVDRLALIDDKFMLAFAGHGKIVDAIDMSKAFKGETSHVVWSSISSNIGHIRKLMEEYVFDKEKSVKDKIEENLNKIIIALAEPIYKRLGWEAAETDNHCDKLLRSQVIGALGKCGHKELIEEANKMFNKHYEAFLKYSADPKTSTCELIDPDLRSTVYGIVNRNSGPETFDKLVELYKCAKMQDEKVRLLGSLGLSPLGEVREKCMNFTFTDAVRKQDRHCSLLSVAASGAQGRRQLWTFVQSKIATLKDDLGSTHLLGHILKGSIRSFASQQNYDFALEFFKKNPVPCERTIQQGCEEILNNMSQLKRDGDLLVKYLSN